MIKRRSNRTTSEVTKASSRTSLKRTLYLFLLVGTISSFAILVFLPFFLNTPSSYPITIVDGNSMYPTYSSGDVIIFKGLASDNNNNERITHDNIEIKNPPIANGTVIVYVQGTTGMPALDFLLRPIVIHRVVGIVIQHDNNNNNNSDIAELSQRGINSNNIRNDDLITYYYRTKGDNNKFNDPALVKEDQVLGTPIYVIPRVGSVLQFLKSPQGLITVVSTITFIYLLGAKNDLEKEKKKKDRLLCVFAEMALNGQIKQELYEKLKLAIELAEEISIDHLTDKKVIALVDWVKNGGLDAKCNIEKGAVCPECNKPLAVIIKSTNNKGDIQFVFCPDH